MSARFLAVALLMVCLSRCECLYQRCEEGQTTRDDTCDLLETTVQGKVDECGPPLNMFDVGCIPGCVSNEYLDGKYCYDASDTEACFDAIKDLTCDQVDRDTVLGIQACADLNQRMYDDCLDYEQIGDDDDWDD